MPVGQPAACSVISIFYFNLGTDINYFLSLDKGIEEKSGKKAIEALMPDDESLLFCKQIPYTYVYCSIVAKVLLKYT